MSYHGEFYPGFLKGHQQLLFIAKQHFTLWLHGGSLTPSLVEVYCLCWT